jgi:uncharacterized membrane protein
MACGMMQLIPAFQSPDEIVHLLRADMVSHGQPLLTQVNADEPGRTGGMVDTHFFMFGQWMQKIVGPHRDRSVSPAWLMNEATQYDWLDDEIFVNAAPTGYYAPFIYLPHALGLKLSRELDLSIGHSYKVMRMLVTLMALGLIFWAWQIWRPTLLVQALVLMPMALFQIISPTIDGLCFALALLVLSLFFLQWQEGGKATRWQAFAFYFAIFLLVTSRTNLIPILLLPLALLLRNRTWPRLAATALLLAASAGWTLFGLVHTEDKRVVRAHSTEQIIVAYLQDPLEFLRLVGRTVADPFQGHVIASSFVGNLGWGDAPIPVFALAAISCGLLVAAVMTLAATTFRRQDAAPRAILAVAGLGSVLLAFFALAVTWNDHPARVIEGLQGRYFIIPAMFLAAALGSVRMAPAGSMPMAHRAFIALYAIFCLCVLAVTLQGRYGMGVAVFDF